MGGPIHITKIKQLTISLETDAASVFISMKDGKVVDSFSIGGKKTVLNGKAIQINPHRLTSHPT